MPGELEERLQVVKQLTELFRFERLVYLWVNIISLIVLVGSSVFLLIKEGVSEAVLVPFLGSSGLITFATGRLLRMWDEALKRIVPLNSGEKDGR